MTRKLIPYSDLIGKLTILASEDDATGLDAAAFWSEFDDLTRALRDGMEALMQLAADEEIGWDLNSGWRCDVDFRMYRIFVCDNKGDDNGRAERQFELQAATAQGAIAAGILAVFQARAAKAEGQ